MATKASQSSSWAPPISWNLPPLNAGVGFTIVTFNVSLSVVTSSVSATYTPLVGVTAKFAFSSVIAPPLRLIASCTAVTSWFVNDTSAMGLVTISPDVISQRTPLKVRSCTAAPPEVSATLLPLSV